jgi:hypothetical protein
LFAFRKPFRNEETKYRHFVRKCRIRDFNRHQRKERYMWNFILFIVLSSLISIVVTIEEKVLIETVYIFTLCYCRNTDYKNFVEPNKKKLKTDLTARSNTRQHRGGNTINYLTPAECDGDGLSEERRAVQEVPGDGGKGGGGELHQRAARAPPRNLHPLHVPVQREQVEQEDGLIQLLDMTLKKVFLKLCLATNRLLASN